MSATSPAPSFSSRPLVALILLLGVGAAGLSYWLGRRGEERAVESEFARRATLRHALTHEILGRYEDALFGLATLFMSEADVSRADFVRVASQLEERISGAHAFEWVPAVADADRTTFEATVQPSYPRHTFHIAEFDSAGRPRPAAKRPYYYPITYLQPLRGNEVVLGFDLANGSTRAVLERARISREILVTPQVRLVQESDRARGVVMVLPVFRAAHSGLTPPSAASDEQFAGFVQCVFRVADLLETTHNRQPATTLDMLFVDASETDPAKRILYHRPADRRAPDPAMTEAEFRRGGLVREFKIPFGQRDWRVLFRPQAGWLEEQFTAMPLLRSGGVLLLTALLAGIVQLAGRRPQTIRPEVAERNGELAESRRQLAALLHALPGMAYRATYGERLTVLFASEGARELTGWSAEELVAGAVHFRDFIHPDDLGRVREATKTALREHRDVEVEYRIRPRSGGEKWVLSRGRGVYADGKLDVFDGLAIDITAQKSAESARLALDRKPLER